MLKDNKFSDITELLFAEGNEEYLEAIVRDYITDYFKNNGKKYERKNPTRTEYYIEYPFVGNYDNEVFNDLEAKDFHEMLGLL